MEAPTQSDLLRRLLSETQEPKHFDVLYEIPVDPDSPLRPSDLLPALDIRKDMLSDVATAALGAIDELNRTDDSDWLDFRWKLTALIDSCIKNATVSAKKGADPIA